MANIFTRALNALRKKEKEPVSSFINLSRYGTSSKPSMTLAAVYRCVSVISLIMAYGVYLTSPQYESCI